MHALIIASGAGRARRHLRELARVADLVIAVDGGGEAALRAGVQPDLLVGDMDSIAPGPRARLKRSGVELLAVPAAKDQTDAELALAIARERGATDVVLTAMLGGRLDHAVANVFLLLLARRLGMRATLVDGPTEVRLAEDRVVLDGVVGDLVSLIPLSPTVERITTVGLRYPLANERLVRGTTRGISNVIDEVPAGLRQRGRGELLVIHVRQQARRPRAAAASARRA